MKKELSQAISKEQIGNIYIASILDTRKENLEGKYFAKIRITYHRKQYYFPTGISLSTNEWKKLPATKNSILIEKKEIIKASFFLIWDAAKKMHQDGNFSIDRLSIIIGHRKGKSVNDIFQETITYHQNERNKPGTAIDYRSTLNVLMCFKCGKKCERKKKQQCSQKEIIIDFDWINYNNINKFIDWNIERGLTPSTINHYLRNIRHICRRGIKQGCLKPANYIFNKDSETPITIQRSAKKEAFYTLEQMKIFAAIPVPADNIIRQRAKDLFLFEFWSNGINAKDLILLKWEDFNFTDTSFSFLRVKTADRLINQKPIYVPLFDPMITILEKWGTDPKKDKYVFPFLKGIETEKDILRIASNLNNNMGKHLKEIVREFNDTASLFKQIPKGISPTYARHSFATILQQNHVPEAYIRDALGHSDNNSNNITTHYTHGYTNEQARQYNSLLTFEYK